MPSKPSYLLSTAAADDLETIARYTVKQFGSEQAKQYGAELELGFAQLAEFPLMGKSAENLHPGLRRFELRLHAVFYLPRKSDIYIVRVLHVAMDASAQLTGGQ